MSNPEWGIKRVCPSCSIKYYDFNKEPIICPKCEFMFDPDLLLKSRKGRSIATKTEDDIISNDVKKEEETLEDDINTLEDDEEILEIDDEADVQDNDLDSNLEKNIDENNDDLEIMDDDLEDDDLEDKNDFSIEINDEAGNSSEDEK